MINGLKTKQNKLVISITSGTKRAHKNKRLTNRVRKQTKVHSALVALHKFAENLNKDKYKTMW